MEELPSPPLTLPDVPTQHEVSIVAVDDTSLESFKTFMTQMPGSRRRGILFGTIGQDGFTVIVDAIYEGAQDNNTGELLRDSRFPMVKRLAKMMGIQPVGIFVMNSSEPVGASDLVRVCQLEDAISHVILVMTDSLSAMIATAQCLAYVTSGRLTPQTSLHGPTVNGGLSSVGLYKELAVVKRTVNDVIHTGFYRLNRPNHTPTMDDVKVFLAVRREKAGINKLHLQLADFHLLIYLATVLGEPSVERIILAIFQEEDELVEDLLELIMA